MPKFKDTEGREWNVAITTATLKRVRELTGVKLGEAVADGFKVLNELFHDFEKLGDVLFAIVKPEADKDGVTSEQFGSALGGDVLNAASEAMVKALVDFFPDAKTRECLRRAISKNKEVQAMLGEQAAKLIEAISPEEEVAKIKEKMSNASATNSPASSESPTQDRSPSAS